MLLVCDSDYFYAKLINYLSYVEIKFRNMSSIPVSTHVIESGIDEKNTS